MMKQKEEKSLIAEKVVGYLEELLGDILTGTGCHGKWGEIDIPECIRQEYEDLGE